MSVPQIRTPVVARPRLLAQVSEGVAGPLTVVSAAAGAGKTVLLATWIARGLAPGPVAWLALDPFDDDPGVFWAYVVGSLRRQGVRLPDSVGEPIRVQEIDRSFLARLAGALAGQPRPVVLVLDEFENVTRRTIHQELTFVLRNSGPMLRLVVLTRHAGLLALPRYRLSGEVVQIGAHDLAFTCDEAAALLRQHGIRLSAEALGLLTEHTGGWAAGLRLCAVAMQRRVDPDAFVMALPVSDATLTSYLIEEVLNSQAEEVRQFLLRTSIVDRLCPALADALSGRSDSCAVLAGLQTTNVLTEALDDTPGWYRYYPLFAQVLRQELRRQHPELVAGLHGTASAWFDAAGLIAEAASHAAAAGDWPQAASTVVRRLAVGELLAGREATRLGSVFESMPAGVPGAMPAVVRAARAVMEVDAPTCRAQLRAAEAQLDDVAKEDRAPVRACVAVTRAVLAGIAADADAAQAARADAEAQLAGLAEVEAEHPVLRALMLASVAKVQLWAGRFEAAEQTLREGIVLARRPGCEHPRLTMIERLAWIEYRKGHLRRAAELGEEAVQLAETGGLPVRHRTGAGHLTLAMVALEWNDRAGFRQHLGCTEKSVGSRPDPFVATVVPMLRAWQYARASDFRRAFAALAEVPTGAGDFPLPPWLATRVTIEHAAIHLRHGDVPAAAAALERAPERGVDWTIARAGVAVAAGAHQEALDLLAPVLAGTVPEVDASAVEAWLLAARIRLDARDRSGAREGLGRALDAARREGHRRAFVDAGLWVRGLLRANRDLATLHRWLGPPLIDRPPAGPPATGRPARDRPYRVDRLAAEAPAMTEPLTDRERTVLTRMGQAMSTEDIAVELFLSVNTVKTHQKSIYRKLSVARRNDAVRRARELQII